METTTIPFSLPLTARSWEKAIGSSAKDQQLINAFYETASDNEQGSKILYVTKRAGSWVSVSSVGTGVIALKMPGGDIGNLYILSNGDLTTVTTVYGNVVGKPNENTNYYVADLIVGTNQLIAFSTTAGGGWYLWYNATTTNFPTFQGDTHTNTTIDNIASTTGIYPGQLITGTGIQAGTRVATITSATAITTTLATTGTATITITKAAVAKIIDADFPTSLRTGPIVQLDGYFFVCDFNGNIYQSALNDPSSWAATDVLNADYSGDQMFLLFKVGNYIGAAGRGGTVQYFYNAGNPTGSILSPAQNLTLSGVSVITTPLQFDGSLYCLCAPGNAFWSMYGLYRITGANTFTRVSDDVWSSIIADLNLSMMSPAIMANKHVIVIHSTDDTVAVVYDPSVNMFSLVQRECLRCRGVA